MIASHNYTISLAKAFCIILMVVGHSGCLQYLNDFIYLFHMPCFFLVSGYMFKEKYLSGLFGFIMKKFRALWWPFVKWSLLFLAFHNVFVEMGLYENTYTLNDFKDKVFHILTLTGSEQLLGGFWFLKELLYASVISAISLKVLFYVTKERMAPWLNGIILVVFYLLMAFVLGELPFKIPTISSKTMLATAFFLSGYTLARIPLAFVHNYNLLKAFAFLGIVAVLPLWFKGSMDITGFKIFIYYIAGITGALGILNLSGKITGKAQQLLDSVGTKTLYILVFHMISFKLVSLIKIKQFGLPMASLSDFPVIGEYNNYYWIIYSVVGVLVPIVLWYLEFYVEKGIKKIVVKND